MLKNTLTFTARLHLLVRRIAATLIDIGLLWLTLPILTILEVPTIHNPATIITIGLTYQALAEASFHHGSVGKRVMKLAVTTNEGERVPVITAFVRNFFKIISVFGLGLGILSAQFSKTGQTWHDNIADCKVTILKTKKQKLKLDPLNIDNL